MLVLLLVLPSSPPAATRSKSARAQLSNERTSVVSDLVDHPEFESMDCDRRDRLECDLHGRHAGGTRVADRWAGWGNLADFPSGVLADPDGFVRIDLGSVDGRARADDRRSVVPRWLRRGLDRSRRNPRMAHRSARWIAPYRRARGCDGAQHRDRLGAGIALRCMQWVNVRTAVEDRVARLVRRCRLQRLLARSTHCNL